MVSIAEAFATIRPDFSKFDAETQAGLQKSLNSITGSLLGVGTALTAGLTVPIVGVGAAALKSSMTFESAFAGVVKTVDATAGELDILRTGILDLSKDLPASAASIADVAMSAGQLGIQVPNILDFTRVMVDLGEATNLTATDAAQALARFANITQMSQQDFDRLGSAVVALGNNMATTEAEIVQFALRIAGAGSQIGLSEDQILAWGAALSSVGVEAEAGGTAISRVFVDIANAVASGGPEVARFAQVADMSVREFSRSFREDASSAVMTFIEGLGDLRQSGANVFAVLEDLGLAEVRVRDALLRASGAGNLLRQSLDLSAEGWEQNVALTREAELRYGTAESRLAMLRNQFQAAAITLGDALVPMMLRLVDLVSALTPYIEGAARVFAELPGPIQVGAVALAALAAAIGPVLLLAGGMAAGFSALVPVIGAATAALTGFNVAMLANPVTAGLVVAGLAAGVVAAKLFGDAMKDANDELARSLRISEQSKTQTQEYIFDLQRREQLIREEIAALEKDADGWVLFNGHLQSTQVVSGYLQAELKGVTEELSAQEAALLQFAKQEKLTAEQTDALRELMDEFGGSAVGAANDLAQLTPQMVATGVAARVMRLWMSETLPPMVGMALGMKALVDGIQQVQQVAEMQAGLNGLSAAILGVAGVTDAYDKAARGATGSTRGLTEAQREAEQAAKDTAEAVKSQRQALYEVERAMESIRQSIASDVDKLGRTVVTALQRQHQQELDSRLATLEAERIAIEGAHANRLRLLDREKDAALAALDAQLAALDDAAADDRLRKLQEQLALAWDPREQERIQDEITAMERDAERQRIQAVRASTEEQFSARQRALEDEQRAALANLDRQVADARRSYGQVTEAWRLEARAREMLAAGEMDAITALITSAVPEWAGQWQSFGESVIDGPLTDIAAKVREVISLMGSLKAGSAGGGGGLADSTASQIAALQVLGQNAVKSGSPTWALENTRDKIRGLGGVPSFAVGGFIPEPTLAVVGDRPGGEHVFGDDQLRRAIREETRRGVIELHNYTVLDGAVIDHRVERVIADATGQAAGRGRYGA